MTYLDIVNNVLRRLRESAVTSVSQDAYSQLIGIFVNQAKTMVEDAWMWNALRKTYTFQTTENQDTYAITGLTTKFQPLALWNTDQHIPISQQTLEYLTNQKVLIDQTSSPMYYAVAGKSSTGEQQLLLYPTPDNTYNMSFLYYADQDELSADTDEMLCPSLPVILAATALALEERGEDTGQSPNTMWAQYEKTLGAAMIRDIEAGSGGYDIDTGQLI